MNWILLRSIYFHGIPVIFVVLLLFLTLDMYRQYYVALRKYIEAEGKIEKQLPSSEIDEGDVGGAVLTSFLCGCLWPLIVVLAILGGLIYGTKSLIELPFHIITKKLIAKHRAKIITSPRQEMRDLINKYEPKKEVKSESL